MPLSPWNRKKPRLEETTINAQFSLCCCTSKCRMAKSRPAFFVLVGIWGAHATRVLIAATRRNVLQDQAPRTKLAKAGRLRQHASRVCSPDCNPSSSIYNLQSQTGGIAQLVERQLCKLEVRGSNPLASTSSLGGRASSPPIRRAR